MPGNTAGFVSEDSVFYIFLVSVSRFPFCFTGKLANSTINTDEIKTVFIKNMAFSDAFKKSRFLVENIISHENSFIGIVSPSDIEAAFIKMDTGSSVVKSDFVSPDMGVILFKEMVKL